MYKARSFLRFFTSADYLPFTKNTYQDLDAALSSPKRFLSIEEREELSDHTYDTIKRQCRGRYFTRHRDCFVMKSPEDIVIYQQFLQIVQPKTIIEFGAFNGASALWFSDMARLYGIDCSVYSYDIDLSLIQEKVLKIKPDSVKFFEGDSYQVEKMFDHKFLMELPRPLLVVEDCHHNTEGIMQFFHKYLREGDYMAIEDTHPLLPGKYGVYGDDPDYEVWTPAVKKLDNVQKFLNQYKDYYAVDGFFCDFFGYNYTWNMNGWIRRMQVEKQ